MRLASSLALLFACAFRVSVAHAAPSVLIGASDPAQIAGLQIAKVVAADSSVWLSVSLSGHSKLAVVTSLAQVEPAPAADEWLRALDFSTRVRVSPPPGPLAACTRETGDLADSGSPELPSLSPSEVRNVASELELRRSFAAAGLELDPTRVAEFAAGATAPFRVALYQAPDGGANTAAMRLSDSGPALAVPGVVAAGRDAVPVTLLTLATAAVLPATPNLSDPSAFAVKYFGATARTDYAQARAAWLAEDPTRWLEEARASSAFAAFTVIPGAGEVEPALWHYFNATPTQRDVRACLATVQSALARASREASAYACAAGDDLSRSLNELDFGTIRLSRAFGSIGPAGITLRASDEAEQGSHVVATDFDAKDCPARVMVSPGTGGVTVPVPVSSPDPSGSTNSSGVDSTSVDYSSTEDPASATSDGCGVTVFSDSCSGNSTSDSSSSDSCSGNSTSDSSSSDSCSGNSTSDSSSSDSSGCGHSNYDGDTCSGSSSSSASPDGKTSAALEPGRSTSSQHRPRRVHLSLLTLLLALVALPLRRRKLWRGALAP